MFDELKEVKYLKKSTIFQESYNVKYFKETKHLQRLQKAEVYLEPKRASTIELFVNILKAFYFRNKNSITDVRLGYI